MKVEILLVVSVAVIKTLNKNINLNQLGAEGVGLAYSLQVPLGGSCQGRELKAGTETQAMGALLTGLHSMTYSACFLICPRATWPLPTVR